MTSPPPPGPSPDSPPPGPKTATASGPQAPKPIDPYEDPQPAKPTKARTEPDTGPTIPVPAPGGPSVPKVLQAA